jgi:hypothetical protein
MSIHRLTVVGENPIVISSKFKDRLEEKYGERMHLSFNDAGELLYDGKNHNIKISNDIEIIIRMILKISRHYKKELYGTFNFTTKCHSGTVYIFKDHSAIMDQYNINDISTYDMLHTIIERTIYNKRFTEQEQKEYDDMYDRHDNEVVTFFENIKDVNMLVEGTKTLKITKTIDDYTCLQLREMANKDKIKGRSNMTKKELFAVLNL